MVYRFRRLLENIRLSLRDRKGTAAIEFAIAFPVYLIFFLNLVEFGIIMFGNAMINDMVAQAARTAMIGCPNGAVDAKLDSQSHPIFDANGNPVTVCSNEADAFDINALKSQIETVSLHLVQATDSSKFTMNISPIGSIPSGKTFPVNGQNDLGNGGDVVVFYVQYTWPVMNPASIVRKIFGNMVNFTSVTMIRNEPFGTLDRT